MNWRKLNRSLHRDIGYFFIGMTIIYSISGIVMNHKRQGGDASIVTKSLNFSASLSTKANVDKEYIETIISEAGESDLNYKNFYLPSDEELMIYLNQGHINVNITTGEAKIVKVRRRAVFYEFNFLHYNKPKRLWTWFADIFAGALIFMAISGMLIRKDKKGIKGVGGIYLVLGLIIPMIFLFLFLWRL